MRRAAEQAMTLGRNKASGVPATSVADLDTVTINRHSSPASQPIVMLAHASAQFPTVFPWHWLALLREQWAWHCFDTDTDWHWKPPIRNLLDTLPGPHDDAAILSFDAPRRRHAKALGSWVR
jgi:hypothetical protein